MFFEKFFILPFYLSLAWFLFRLENNLLNMILMNEREGERIQWTIILPSILDPVLLQRSSLMFLFPSSSSTSKKCVKTDGRQHKKKEKAKQKWLGIFSSYSCEFSNISQIKLHQTSLTIALERSQKILALFSEFFC